MDSAPLVTSLRRSFYLLSLALYQRYIMSSLGKNVVLVFKIDAYTRRKWPIQLVRTFSPYVKAVLFTECTPYNSEPPLDTARSPYVAWKSGVTPKFGGICLDKKHEYSSHLADLCERVSCRIYRFGYVSINPNFLSMEKTGPTLSELLDKRSTGMINGLACSKL